MTLAPKHVMNIKPAHSLYNCCPMPAAHRYQKGSTTHRRGDEINIQQTDENEIRLGTDWPVISQMITGHGTPKLE